MNKNDDKQAQQKKNKRKTAQRRTMPARNEWEETFDAIEDFVTILDTEKRIIRMNNSIAQAFSCETDTVIGCHCYDFFWNRKTECVGCPASLVLEDHLPHTAEFENRKMNKTFQVSASPIFDDNKKLTGIVHVSRDITYRKLSEKALQATNEEMEIKVEQRTKELKDTNFKLQKEIVERKFTETQLVKKAQELDVKSKKLEEANIALRVMLNTREIDQGELEEKVLSNVKELILPYIDSLKNSRMNNDQIVLLKTLESNVKKIISPFTIKLSSLYLKLTPKEIQIANLVKNGRTNKEIANVLNVSLRTIEFHREHIREKLDIKNEKINLRSYLQTFD